MADAVQRRATGNQAVQRELVEEARREPGIAEALAAYEAIRPFLGQPEATRPQVRFATGRNS